MADTVYRDVIDQENAGRGYYYFVEGETSSGRKTAMSDTSEVGAAKVYPVKYHSMVLLSGENKVRISWVIAETDNRFSAFLEREFLGDDAGRGRDRHDGDCLSRFL